MTESITQPIMTSTGESTRTKQVHYADSVQEHYKKDTDKKKMKSSMLRTS